MTSPRDWSRARLAFVCSGNICRSPMATVICEDLFRRADLSPMVISMGTLNIVGRRAARHAIEAVDEIGLDLSDHRSQGLNKTVLSAADVVFAMERHHVETLASHGVTGSVRLLSQWADEPMDGIWDPVGGSLDDFRASRDLIKECLETWFAEQVE